MQEIEYCLEKLRALVRERGLTNTEIGEIIGVKRNTVGSYLSGKAPMRLDALGALAEYFGVPLSYFFKAESTVSAGSVHNIEDPLIKQLVEEKDKRIEDLKEQLVYLKRFYDHFSEDTHGTKGD